MDIVDFPSRRTGACMHDTSTIGSFELETCPKTGEATWYRRGHEVDPAVALAALFGQFDLTAVVPSVSSPGPTVFAYRPSGRRGRSAMRGLPRGSWFEAAPELWLTHDGDLLLLSPSDPLMAENLSRTL